MFISIPLVMAAELHCPSALGSDAIPALVLSVLKLFSVRLYAPMRELPLPNGDNLPCDAVVSLAKRSSLSV
jgi:hypothetical protein